jgi:hypothetical protein
MARWQKKNTRFNWDTRIPGEHKENQLNLVAGGVGRKTSPVALSWNFFLF